MTRKKRTVWPTRPVLDRAMRKSAWEDHGYTDPCLCFNGCKGKGGYGRIGTTPGKLGYVHRVAWEILVGPIEPGMTVDHLCKVPNCWNINHLEIVTQWENNRRGTSPVARNIAATHCIHGHPFAGENLRLYTYPNGKKQVRICRECERAAGRRKRRARTATRRAARAA